MARDCSFSLMRTLIKIITCFEEWGLIVALSAMTILFTLSMVSRYITNISTPWADELVMFLFIWATLLGASIGVRKKAHLGVAVVQNLCPPKIQILIMVVITLCCVFTCAVLVWYGIQMVHLQFSMGQKSSQLGVPMFLAGLSVPVGLLLCLFRFVEGLMVRLITKET